MDVMIYTSARKLDARNKDDKIIFVELCDKLWGGWSGGLKASQSYGLTVHFSIAAFIQINKLSGFDLYSPELRASVGLKTHT